MKITSDFAPPLRIVAPFFLIGAAFFILSSVSLFWIDIGVSYLSFTIIGWVHLFLLGFVVTIIFGAMGQLLPVLLERGHSFVKVFILLPYLLLFGICLLIIGFWYGVVFLPYGGLVISVAIVLYLADAFATLLRAERFSVSVGAIGVSHIFLIAAIAAGVLMTLFFAHGFNIDIKTVMFAHVALGVGGYIFLLIIGVAIILLPMFGLAHDFDKKATWCSFWFLIAGVLSVAYFSFVGFCLILASLSFFIYQIILIHAKRVRKEKDIWYLSLRVSFISLAVSIIFMILSALTGSEKFIKLAGFIFGMGFLAFLITGHIYKIIPFLVWFERFSPLVGKQKIPMLHQMIPKKISEYQLWFSSLGLLLCSIGMLFDNKSIWFSGVSFLSIGSLFLFGGVVWMIRFKQKDN